MEGYPLGELLGEREKEKVEWAEKVSGHCTLMAWFDFEAHSTFFFFCLTDFTAAYGDFSP